ncbi:unnamed protein product [Gongylonema pulchrum]|uniref:Uncharacterized protein n=1 Tax=Gongylonema pulchrum TaxID=637853 RepID=A0A3P6SH58_9BILA|nr:unnamed protein product [Gongylonema pulchrum]
MRKRCNDLTVEMNECRSTTKAASKGNSMFFELKARNDFLVHQNDVYQRQIGDLRHELMFALSLATGTGTSGNSYL